MTTRNTNVGILGIGTYLPDEVRTNDWWPEHVVARWTEKRAAARARFKDAAPTSDGMALVMKAMAEIQDDPFLGAVERRVMAPGTLASELELRAAKQAIERAGIDPAEIGLVLVNSSVPDHLVTNNACLLHHNLGLSVDCLTMATEAACNSLMLPLTLAEQMIAGGRTRYALLVQSCTVSPLLDASEPASPWFGDGATAVVVGAVSEGHGILGTAHRTDGSLNRTLVASVPAGRWYDEGRVVLHSADPSGARRSFLDVADTGKEVADAALAEGGYVASDVRFFGVHQGTPWIRKVTQEHFGLSHAKSVETFKFAASLFGANIPLGLSIGEREGLLKAGDLVLMFGGGAGLTYSSMLVRWGR